MLFLTSVFALLIELFVHPLAGVKRYDWYGRYLDVVDKFTLKLSDNAVLRLLMPLLLPLVIVGYIQHQLADYAYGLPGLLFGILVLFYCLRLRTLDHALDADIEAAQANGSDPVLSATAHEVGVDPYQPDEAVDALLVSPVERVFAVLFWLAVLGPLGAVWYRLTWVSVVMTEAHAKQSPIAQAAQRLLFILDWVPLRLTALGYAVTGSFDEAYHRWHNLEHKASEHWVDPEDDHAHLVAAGSGAMHRERFSDSPEDTLELLKATRALLLRTLVAWILVMALMTLGGWAA